MNLSIIPQYAQILSTLQRIWETVQTSKTMRVVLIEGEGGMKKTQLVRQFMENSQAKYLTGYGSGAPEPYLPLRLAYESMLELNIVQEQLSKTPEEVSDDHWKIALTTFAQVLRMVHTTSNPVWKQLFQWQPTAVVSSSKERSEIREIGNFQPVSFPELFTFAIGDLTAISPIVLFLQNLDMADTSVIESLTRTILPALKKNPLLFIADFETARGENQQIFEEFVEFTKTLSGTEHFEIKALHEDDIRIIASAEHETLFQKIDQGNLKAVLQDIRRLTGGNLGQTQDVLFWLEKSDKQDIHQELAAIPDFLNILHEKFMQLSETERHFLQMAATQGNYFCQEAVIKALYLSEEGTQSLLAQLAGEIGKWIRFNITVFLENRELQWYEFLGHKRFELVSRSIPDDLRIKYHQDLVQALESVYGEDAFAIAGLLAVQYGQAKISENAAHYQALLARHANEQGEFIQGLKYAQNALENLKYTPDTSEIKRLHCRLLIEQGCSMINIEQAYLAEDILKNAYQLADSLEELDLQSEAGRYIGELLFNQHKWEEGFEITKHALNLAVDLKNWSIVIGSMENMRSRVLKQAKIEQNAFLAYCDQIIAIIKSDISPSAQVAITEIMEDQGWLYNERGENDVALCEFGKAFEYLSKLKPPELYSDIYYKLYRWTARAWRKKSHYNEALQQVENAIRWADISHKRKNQAFAQYEKGVILQCVGRHGEGEQEIKKALRLLKYSSDLETIAHIENDYGFFLDEMGRFKEAKEMYQKSYDHRLSIHNFEQLQEPMNNLAFINKTTGAFQEATSIYQQLFDEGIIQRDQSRQALSLNHLGDIYRIQNRMGDAEQAHLKAIQLCEETHNLHRKAIALTNLAQTYLVIWNIERANDVLLQSDALYRENVSRQNWYHYHCILFLGRLVLCQNNVQEALMILNNSVQELEKVYDLLWIGIGRLNQGLAHLVAGEPEKALAIAKQALEMLQKMEVWRYSEAHHLLARCYLALGDWDQAQTEIDLAKAQFMKFQLFHRVYQAENTELHIDEARETGNVERWRRLDLDELRLDFNHLGI